MAPEIISRKDTYKAGPCDIFSLGVILFIFAFGVPPFNCAKMEDKLYAKLNSYNPINLFKYHPNTRLAYREGKIDPVLIDLIIDLL